jgi:hypothetical protein
MSVAVSNNDRVNPEAGVRAPDLSLSSFSFIFLPKSDGSLGAALRERVRERGKRKIGQSRSGGRAA